MQGISRASTIEYVNKTAKLQLLSISRVSSLINLVILDLTLPGLY